MIDRYIGYIASVRRYSVRTQQIYRDVLEQFASVTGMSDFSAVNSNHVRGYEMYLLDEKGLDSSTVNLHLSEMSWIIHPTKTVGNPMSII